MRVGIIGSGTVGQHLGAGFVKHGHEVWVGTRQPTRLAEWAAQLGPKVHVVDTAEAARQGELLVVATLWTGTEAALKAAGPENFKGKVVLDATNPLRFAENAPPTLSLGFDTSAGEQVQQWLPGARVVKAYNTVGAPLMVDPTFQGGSEGRHVHRRRRRAAKDQVADIVSAIRLGGAGRRAAADVAGARADVRALGPCGNLDREVEPRLQADPHLTGAVLALRRRRLRPVWQARAGVHTSRPETSMNPSDLDGPPEPVSRREFRTVMAGLLLVLTLASLDQNIVATALPGIVSELGGLAHLSWVVTAFLVASTATTPLYGKLSDSYGRRAMFFVAVGVFLAGSALCGLSQDMGQLIAFRAVQGLGAGGLITLAQTTVGDLLAPRERGRYQGLFTAVFAACSVAGPLLGGFITDALSWRWIFYINLPVGALALGLIAVALRRPNRAVRHRIDFAGAALMVGGTTATILVLTLDASREAWSRPATWIEAAAAVLCFGLLVVRERHAAEPILPPRLFRDRVFVVGATVVGLTAVALFGAVIFLPLFFQLVLGAAASRAGLMLSPHDGRGHRRLRRRRAAGLTGPGSTSSFRSPG